MLLCKWFKESRPDSSGREACQMAGGVEGFG